MYQIGLEATLANAEERCMLPCGYMGLYHLCLPHSDVAAERVWRALDGSGYYYIEKQLVPRVNETTLGNVYGPDGTCYVLDENGMITALRDLDGNVINVSVHEYNAGSETDWYKTVVYTNWGGAKITLKFRCRPLVNWVGEPRGRGMEWENQPIECWVLDTVSGPKVGTPDGEETIRFEYRNLLEHLNLPAEGNRSVRDPILWRDIFFDNIISPIDGEPMDFGDTMFCTQRPPDQPSPEDYMAQPNREIYVMTSITLPDNRQFRFTYNIAGKIAAITYPDGGSRTYWYGNTPGRSHDDMGFFRRAACQGESALGGVSMVWQDNPSAGVLERAYAYSNPKSLPVITDTTIDYVSTLLWKGDKSVEVHDFYPQPSGGSIVLDFGFSGWTTGKSKRTRLFDFSSFTYGDAAETFRNRFRCPAPPYAVWDDPNAGLASMMSWMNATDTNWLREETLNYRNDFAAGPKVWEWTLPRVYCDSGNCTNDISQPLTTIAGFYMGVIPTNLTCYPPQSGGNEAPGAFPDANPVVTGKTLKLRESGQVLTKTVTTTWADVYSEPNAVKTLETETDWNGSGPAVRKEYTYATPFWPAPIQLTGGEPGRLLGLPSTVKVTDGSGQRVAETVNVYAEPFGAPASFHPVETDQWIEGSRWAKSTYHYGGSPLRLTSVKTWDGGVEVSSANFVYEPGGSKLLKEAAVKDGTTTVQKIFFKYDPYTGLLLRRTDLNGKTGSGEIGAPGDNYLQMDYDPYNRLAGVRLKRSGEPDIQLTSLEYSNAGAPFRVTRKDYVNAETGGTGIVWKETVTENDSFGRPAKGSTTLGNETGGMQWALGWKDYDVLGRVAAEWGPAKSTSDTGWYSTPAPHVETHYDALGRVTMYSRFSPTGEWVSSWGSQYGAVVDGSQGFTTVMVADEKSRWRMLYKNGYDRIVRVDEQNPDSGSSWRTDYLYDTLGNLTQVHKRNAGGGSGQVRTFTYDALGRLLSAVLPEFDHQALRYQYDDRGNLLYKRKDQPGQGVLDLESMTYDGLGRILSRTVTHEGRTTSNTFGYDQGTYGKGRLSWDRSETDGTAVLRTYTYESRGLLEHRQDGITRGGPTEYFMTSYEYEPGGAVKKAIYPSGTVVENTAGPGGVVDNVKVGDSSSTSVVYQRLSSAANGAPEAVLYADGAGSVNGGRLYDPTTLWLKELKVGPGVGPGTLLDNSSVMFGLSYGYEKNGNVTAMNRVWRQTAGADSSWLNGSYTYDKLNRLKTYQFTDTRLGMTVNSYRYLMDEYGNLLTEQRLCPSGECA